MSDEHVLSRHAANSWGLTPGKMYLGRIGRNQSNPNEDTVSIYAEGSSGIGDPVVLIGVGSIQTTIAQSPIPTVYGHYVDGMFCGVIVGENGKYNLQIFGIDFGWFIPRYIQPEGQPAFYRWSLKGENGFGEIYNVFPVPAPDGSGVHAEPPFLYPFDYQPGFNANGLRDSPLVSPKTPLFASATGIDDVFESPWRMEYQACNPDDELNDVPPGIRAAWNYLAANCCSGDDEGGNGGGGDDGDPPDDPPPPGGYNCGNRDEVTLTCLIVNQLCTGMFPRPHNFWRWCLVDGEMDCITETGGSCHCDTRTDYFGTPIPNPGDVPLGTVIVVGCGLEGTQTMPPCTDPLPNGVTCE